MDDPEETLEGLNLAEIKIIFERRQARLQAKTWNQAAVMAESKAGQAFIKGYDDVADRLRTLALDYREHERQANRYAGEISLRLEAYRKQPIGVRASHPRPGTRQQPASLPRKKKP